MFSPTIAASENARQWRAIPDAPQTPRREPTTGQISQTIQRLENWPRHLHKLPQIDLPFINGRGVLDEFHVALHHLSHGNIPASAKSWRGHSRNGRGISL